jgi:hypothetical protein
MYRVSEKYVMESIKEYGKNGEFPIFNTLFFIGTPSSKSKPSGKIDIISL